MNEWTEPELPKDGDAISRLNEGGVVSLAADAATLLAADLFHEGACRRLREEASPDALPIILLERTDHLDAFAAGLSVDAQVVIKRLLPGPLALAVRPSSMTPAWALAPAGFCVLSVPARPDVVRLLQQFGRPLLSLSVPSTDGSARIGEATVLDVSSRPARIMREGTPPRSDLERYILMEGPHYPRREQP